MSKLWWKQSAVAGNQEWTGQVWFQVKGAAFLNFLESCQQFHALREAYFCLLGQTFMKKTSFLGFKWNKGLPWYSIYSVYFPKWRYLFTQIAHSQPDDDYHLFWDESFFLFQWWSFKLIMTSSDKVTNQHTCGFLLANVSQSLQTCF